MSADSVTDLISTFAYDPQWTSEDCVVNMLDTINDHHDSYDCDVTWGAIEIYGIEITERIKDTLQGLGVTKFELCEGGFAGMRG